MNTPRSNTRYSKYSKKGMAGQASFGDLNLSRLEEKQLATVCNFGLAKSTWSNYRTAERMLLTCSKIKKRKLELPLGEREVLIFVNWLVNDKKLKISTINNYLSGLRQLHILRGHGEPSLRKGRVGLVLNGKMNMDILAKKTVVRQKRLPVTISVMRLLKATLRDSQLPVMDKLATWSVCCLAFHGCFRIHELLCRETMDFDPRTVLLNEDLIILEEVTPVIQVWLKWPKEEKHGAEFTVEVFSDGSDQCPVRALRKWWSCGPVREDGLPAFRLHDGSALTGRWLNDTLRTLLDPHMDFKKGAITGHSFRAGVPTMMGAAGFADSEMRKVGRWSSRAFEFYAKVPRVSRRQVAQSIGELIKENEK